MSRRSHRRFPNADIRPDDGTIAPWVEGALAAVEHPQAAPELPIDVHGTAFQEAVWRELRKIPLGETRSYADIARAVGDPNATRAVGTANGSNPVAVLVPCHRVIRSDGTLGGYAGGLDRKKKLLAAEGAALQAGRARHLTGSGLGRTIWLNLGPFRCSLPCRSEQFGRLSASPAAMAAIDLPVLRATRRCAWGLKASGANMTFALARVCYPSAVVARPVNRKSLILRHESRAA